MSLTRDDVLKIAHLARLTIDKDAIPDCVNELTNILGLVAQMNEIDTGDTVPMAHPVAATQRLRDDKVTEIDQRELFQSIAPKVLAGLYLVPKVIE